MEEFFNVLTTRGVRIRTSDQAMALGNAVGDIASALGMVEDGNGTEENLPGARRLSMQLAQVTATAGPRRGIRVGGPVRVDRRPREG